MKTVKGVLKRQSEEERFEMSFSDGEIAALETFASDVEKLSRRSFLRSGENFHLKLKFGATADVSQSAEIGLFSEEQWSAFLHSFRPLAGLSNEQGLYGFLKVRSLLARKAQASQTLVAGLKGILKRFNGKQMPFEVKFGIAGAEFDLNTMFENWINAKEFHRDPDKAAIIEQASGVISQEGLRALMTHLIMEKYNAMVELRYFIKLLFSQPGTEVPLSPDAMPDA